MNQDKLNSKIEDSMKAMDDASIVEDIPKTNKMEFSKKIIIATLLFTIIVIIFAMVFMWNTGDSSPMGYLLTGMFAQASAASGVYYFKAKSENQIKLQALYGQNAVEQANQSIEQGQWDNTNNNYDNFI